MIDGGKFKILFLSIINWSNWVCDNFFVNSFGSGNLLISDWDSNDFLSTPKLLGYEPCGPKTSDCGICGLLSWTGFVFTPVKYVEFGYSPGFKFG